MIPLLLVSGALLYFWASSQPRRGGVAPGTENGGNGGVNPWEFTPSCFVAVPPVNMSRVVIDFLGNMAALEALMAMVPGAQQGTVTYQEYTPGSEFEGGYPPWPPGTQALDQPRPLPSPDGLESGPCPAPVGPESILIRVALPPGDYSMLGVPDFAPLMPGPLPVPTYRVVAPDALLPADGPPDAVIKRLYYVLG